ncbi:uncharacterized protein LOC118512227 isoform X2 [Anopheles stephensi]|uniref:uncharacterized protein LOC118512227 isoform X2 n=1 Tax=Anopheles stephensi TaxID=30069 RepID=UPI0016588E15|nr:uncharacterized protein LOC118512227 isoform X2 [Anopheles stephensi]XP_035912238.1 uncharacterized protein LOC118512227 isoform X2 [Anopheles stephensi]XP_035912239.1 uncharacterized protein LOC118512227 isoform X2 [Anopheles stephensi]XP_035912240.1 uncharacterized protein LOC118512227 isoform X2 [Anopheles stephensi]XP_035912241.1 uncharacterized protein LOC118512227 isoform X2 [Anopheles stephensi]
MFGSKLRSWMENHIVRPRKKGNKNKSGNNGNNFGVLTTQNGYKSGSFATDSNIGSPARRSEVSPIQSHTTSRRGWHSPNQDNVPISPKSDHYPIQHRIHNRQAPDGGAQCWTSAYGTVNGQSGAASFHYPQQQQQQQQFNPGVSSPKSISRNGSSYTLEPGPTNVYYSKSVDSYAADTALPYTMPEFDFHAGNTGPSRGIMTGNGSVSTGHNGHLMSHTATVTRGTYSTATSSSNELLEELHSFEGARIKRLHPAATRISSSSSSSVNSTHYNVNNNHNHNNNNHLASGTLPSSQYGSSNGHHQQALATRSSTQAATSTGCSENKYGKLMQQPNQPSKQYGPYYEQQQQQQQPHNGNNNNNLLYCSNSKATNSATNGDGGTGSRNASPLPARGSSACTSPVLRSGAPSAKSNRVINGNNNNNNNSIHLDASASGTGKTVAGSGSSLTASFTSKFHKLTGNRSANGSNASDGASNSKLNHVNNNNAPNGATSNSANIHPYHQHHPQHHHQYQINNVTTHLHPPAQPLPSGKQPPSSSSSSSSPPPGSQAGPAGTTPSPGVHHLHHPSAHGHHHHHPHGPMGHTLSSPESAYSTGYSTDGTSPGGCSYTPEYYINIRTGTHYFPKGTTLPGALHGRTTAAFDRTGSAIPANGASAAGPAGSHHENGSKFKCALNRIEEKHVEFCVDAESHVAGPRACASAASPAPAPAAAAPNLSSFKPTSGATGGAGGSGSGVLSQLQQPSAAAQPQPNQPPNAVAMSPIMQKNLGMQHYRSIESPSPRQRCRIRTNPWLTTADGALASASCIKRTEQDSGSTSSGIKSSSGTDDNKNDNNKPNALSDTDSSSSTEKIVNKKPFTPKSLKKMGDISRLDSKSGPATFGSNQDSDEDATLNEMMGKFDESYHYEKETDILSCSDSDPTDCPTDIDTGQDAGDECDTDDLLDLDFIDTGSVQEVPDKEIYRHTTSCSIHHFPERKASCKQQRTQRSKRTNESGGGSKRRKKLVRTRKKTTDHAALGAGSGGGDSAAVVSRGCRSLGGTPVSLRRNQPDPEMRTPTRGSPLTNRCNSLTFTEVHSLHSRILAISESEKALLRADLEADVKYKQLIHEAESILFSMKSNSSICIKDLANVPPPPLPPREPQPPPSTASLVKETPAAAATTIASPRRVCNPPANKRVEMLRNCEADLRRELAKTCSQKCADGVGNPAELNPAEGVIVNKRLEVLRYETACSLSAPNSPKNTRVLLPRKTHVSNFIHHQARPPCSSDGGVANDLKQSANQSPPPPPPRRLMSKSPTIMRRRFRSQSPHLNIESDSDSDEVSRNLDSKANGKAHRTNHGNNKENLTNHPQPIHPSSQPTHKDVTGKQMNNFRHTIHGPAVTNGEDGYDYTDEAAITNGTHATGMHKSPLISFRSVDIGSPVTDDSYCPQSEPLKRKIYTCSAAFEKIQRSLHHDPDAKQQLIIDALAEIKRSLEDQSVELHELNNTEN